MSDHPTPANQEMVPTRASNRRLWGFSRPVTIALIVVAVLALLAVAGGAYATYDYSQKYKGKILPGTTVAGVHVGGMSRAQALRAVKAAVRPQLHHTISVRWKSHHWKLTPAKVGARSNARQAVDAAFQASAAASFLDKARMKLLGQQLGFHRDVAIHYPRQGVHGYVQGIASGLDEPASDAHIDYSTGWVKIIPEANGQKVMTARSQRVLLHALRGGADRASLPVKVLKPKVTTAAFDEVLLLHIGDNKLYLYQNGHITNSWTVATGQPAYPTPTGIYEITEKRFMPTWINPDPSGWGASMPASIPPGPSNPLGLRALNWSAEGIRFHGTTATYSLGFNASHGCIRMSNSDVIQLYDMVDVGTPIVSTVFGSIKPLVSSTPDLASGR